jgi:hypothetical protein
MATQLMLRAAVLLDQHYRRFGYYQTNRKLGEELGGTSASAASQLLGRMQLHGLVRRLGPGWRNFEVVRSRIQPALINEAA